MYKNLDKSVLPVSSFPFEIISDVIRAQIEEEEGPPPEPQPIDYYVDYAFLIDYAGKEDPNEITNLNLAGRALSRVSEKDLRLFRKLEHADLSDNRFQFFKFGNLEALKTLVFCRNAVRDLPLVAGKYKSLEVLDLSQNRIKNTSLISLACLPKLKVLNLSTNGIGIFKRDIFYPPRSRGLGAGGFQCLEVLDLSHNFLKSDTDTLAALGQLSTLKVLKLDHNQITTLAFYQDKLDRTFPKLSELHLTHNKFEALSEISITMMFPSLEKIWLHGNPLMSPSNPIGAAGIMKVLSEFAENEVQVMDETQIERGLVDGDPNNAKHVDRKTNQKRLNLDPQQLLKVDARHVQPLKRWERSRLETMIESHPHHQDAFVVPEEHKIVDRLLEAPLDELNNQPTVEGVYPVGQTDGTFLTGVPLAQKMKKPTDLHQNIHDEVSENFRKQLRIVSIDRSDEEPGRVAKLPNNIQASIRQLRQVLDNPNFYWALLDKKYQQETKRRQALRKQYSKGAPLKSKSSTLTSKAANDYTLPGTDKELDDLFTQLSVIDGRMQSVEERFDQLLKVNHDGVSNHSKLPNENKSSELLKQAQDLYGQLRTGLEQLENPDKYASSADMQSETSDPSADQGSIRLTVI